MWIHAEKSTIYLQKSSIHLPKSEFLYSVAWTVKFPLLYSDFSLILHIFP